MKFLLVLCFSTLFILLVNGQATTTPTNPQCVDVEDYLPCKSVNSDDLMCSENSKCSCKAKNPYCRCNNNAGEWFIGEDCTQKWTTVQFALVASLPGVGLAILVGVVVYCTRKPSKGKKNKKGKTNVAFNQELEDNMFKNIVFASDMQGRPNSRPPPENMRPPNNTVPMGAMPNHDYSRMPPPADRMSTSRPFNQPYSQQRNIHPPQDRPSMGGPPPQPNSYGSGMGQVLSNPYAKSSPGRPPYEGQGPPQDYSSDYNYRPKQPPVNGTRVMAADFPHSSPSQPPFPQPDYSAPQLQRSVMNGRY
ncbi:uncharacterized protein zgc:158432 isoform X1 [Alosa sapidissima]|uniref:uncharacterized protein zgc:158432 isoform X1 n=1 Tax=Alosa sapidissima TaxID=34773 RepID=UPI001C0A65D6|nr:uncharacterized protein zgc:158432 isoform X1 [Alosa sapidissima]